MEIAIFASKKSYEKDGTVKTFYAYTTKLKNTKSGEEEFFNVKFNDGCDAPKPVDCPINIIVEKQYCSVSRKTRTYTDKETGEPRETTNNILWISRYIKSDKPFIDHSTDDYFMED